MNEEPRVTVDELTQAALSGAIRALEERNSDSSRWSLRPALTTVGIAINWGDNWNWDDSQSAEDPPPPAPAPEG